jgi:hypothetical protein
MALPASISIIERTVSDKLNVKLTLSYPVKVDKQTVAMYQISPMSWMCQMSLNIVGLPNCQRQNTRVQKLLSCCDQNFSF